MMARETAFGVYFATYDTIKKAVGGLLPPPPNAAAQLGGGGCREPPQPLWVSTLAGGLAGSLCWTVIYPFDVVKSRIQVGTVATTNPLKAIAEVYRAEGKGRAACPCCRRWHHRWSDPRSMTYLMTRALRTSIPHLALNCLATAQPAGFDLCGAACVGGDSRHGRIGIVR